MAPLVARRLGRSVISTDPHPELPLDPDVGRAVRPVHFQPTHLLAVFIGGIAGTLTRFGVGHLLPTSGASWPTATFLVNIVGAFLLGALLESLTRMGPDHGLRRRVRLLCGTGFCGALTTYSTYAVEIDLLVRADAPWLASAYAVVTLIAGLLTAVAGIACAAAYHSSRVSR